MDEYAGEKTPLRGAVLEVLGVAGSRAGFVDAGRAGQRCSGCLVLDGLVVVCCGSGASVGELPGCVVARVCGAAQRRAEI